MLGGQAAQAERGAQGVPQRVLVLEDEPNIVESRSCLMKQEGFDVRVASDGTTALRLVESEPPDLVVLDVMLPRRDGYDVCQAIRANRRLDGVKIMMLSHAADSVRRPPRRVDDLAVLHLSME